MTRQFRRKIFYTLVTIFFVLGIGVIFYVNGWRFDIRSFRFKKVGAIFVRSFPQDAKIYLDNHQIKNESDLFQRGTLISNLFPKTYTVKLIGDGYESWQENVTVSPSLVAELKYAVLVPKNKIIVASGTIKNFWLSNKKIIFKKDSGLYLGNKNLGPGEVIGENNFDDVLVHNQKSRTYRWINLASGASVNLGVALASLGFDLNKKFVASVTSDSSNQIILQRKNQLLVLDTEKFLLKNIGAAQSMNTIDAIVSSEKFLVWTEFDQARNESSLFIYDKLLGRKIHETTLPGKNKELQLLPNDQLAILQNDGALYVYQLDQEKLKKIADTAKKFAITQNSELLATLEERSLEIFPLKETGDYHRFNLPEIDRATNILWYFDKNHLFVIYPDHVAFLDLNDSGLRNFVTVTVGVNPKYDDKNNQLYFLDEGGIEKLDFPE